MEYSTSEGFVLDASSTELDCQLTVVIDDATVITRPATFERKPGIDLANPGYWCYRYSFPEEDLHVGNFVGIKLEFANDQRAGAGWFFQPVGPKRLPKSAYKKLAPQHAMPVIDRPDLLISAVFFKGENQPESIYCFDWLDILIKK